MTCRYKIRHTKARCGIQITRLIIRKCEKVKCMWKKAISSLVGVSLIMCAFVGLEAVKRRQSPVEPAQDVRETVNDVPSGSKGADAGFSVAAKGAVLIDAETGEVLFQQDAHKELPLASVTKVMTMLLVMDAVEAGKITLQDEVTISERAASMGGSQMYMEPGEKHTVAQLMEGVAMASANDGCVALAEYVAGSEEIFVERMNQRAAELGMRDSHFVNTNGLPVADHYSSAYDISLMSKELYKHEETHAWFTTWQSTITVGLPGKEKEFGLTNTNKMIKSYSGCNGIKTGFTSDAGYCLSASATRGETHLIAVALGCETSKVRNAEVAKMLDYGFANFETFVAAEAGQVIAPVEIRHAEPQMINAVTSERITALVPKGRTDTVTTQIILDEKVSLPLMAGEKVGTLKVMRDGREVGSCDLVAESGADNASFRELVRRMLTYKRQKYGE